MNARVLELIKNPQIITEADLGILESESAQMPYAQSIRALYLYGVNLYKPENYKENLSRTAAYTTDKKILYQFLNSDKITNKALVPASTIEQENTDNQINEQSKTEDSKPADPELIAEIENTDNSSVLNKFDVDKIIEKEEILTEDFILVNGEKNRLLFDGEENFLEEKSSEVDLDASKESGQLVLIEETKTVNTQIIIDENPSEESISEPKHIEDILTLQETKVENIAGKQESEPEVSSKDISFSGIQDFLPEVKFSVPKNHLDYLNPPKKQNIQSPKVVDSKSENINFEKEKKTFFAEQLAEKELEIENENSISFENTQAFQITEIEKTTTDSDVEHHKTSENEVSFEVTQNFEVANEFSAESEPDIIEPISNETEWKPMVFDAHIPDALIGKQPESESKKADKNFIDQETQPSPEPAEPADKNENKKEVAEEKLIPETERPVFNVSFFGNDVSKIEEKQELQPEIPAQQVELQTESNVGTFINTWQSWLKIDRPKAEENTAKAKEKIIDNFIENNPRISQLKEESSFIIKEKKDDISHLMTETLARLYAEQKLYSKAIKAFEILSEKHPHKKDYFKEKIEEIKAIRKA
jgi:hypothetical protein